MGDLKTKLVVVAIDFGTTYSGYAYSFKSDPTKIFVNADWNDGSNLCTVKAPTVVLFDKNEKFDTFGYEAENKYAELAGDENKHKGWRYYRQFKMELYNNKKLRRNIKLTDDQGQEMLALDVFSAAIEFLKDHFFKRLQCRMDNMKATEVHWVITVPAIWQDGAKQFMIEAAEKAGIPSDQLTLALEPEAAAVYCKEIIVCRAIEAGREPELKSFDTGAQFMVLDLGGGTVDITVHEVGTNGTLKELISPSGGPWGGTLVDSKIMELFEQLYSSSVVRDFMKNYKDDHLDLVSTLELKKRQFKNVVDDGGKVNIKIPYSLNTIFSETNKQSFATALQSSKYADTVTQNRDKINICKRIFIGMYNMSKTKLIEHVTKLLSKPKLVNVQTLLMVGGFAESELMQDAVKRAFPNKSVIFPEQAGTAIVKGAVMYGWNIDSISCRKMPYTYGISVAEIFNSKIHPESKRVRREGLDKCEDVFQIFVKAGQNVEPGKTTVEHIFAPPFRYSNSTTIELYRTKSKIPRFVTDDGCHKVGKIVLNLVGRKTDNKQLVTVTMCFGTTMFEVKVKEMGTENTVLSKFNFLI